MPSDKLKAVVVAIWGTLFVCFISPHLVTAKSSLLPAIGVIVPVAAALISKRLYEDYQKWLKNRRDE